MCLILFSYQPNSDTPLILAANRDEFFERPTQSAHFWEDSPQVLAGKDIISGGTWLGVTKTGRFAAVTNVREPHVILDNPLSRGDLTRSFLEGNDSPKAFLEKLIPHKNAYSGFNLLVGDFSIGQNSLCYLSNRHDELNALTPGIYGLSNHLLDTHWPKVVSGKTFLEGAITTTSNDDMHTYLRQYLENAGMANDDQLPSTGVSYEREKALSAAFINLPDYGTRASTVVTIHQNKITFSEQNYQNAPESSQAIKLNDRFVEDFDISPDEQPMHQAV